MYQLRVAKKVLYFEVQLGLNYNNAMNISYALNSYGLYGRVEEISLQKLALKSKFPPDVNLGILPSRVRQIN